LSPQVETVKSARLTFEVPLKAMSFNRRGPDRRPDRRPDRPYDRPPRPGGPPRSGQGGGDYQRDRPRGDRPPYPPRGPRPPQQQRQPQKQQPQKTAARGEIDLAKAYALRNKTEREEKERDQREAEQRAKERKERRQKLAVLLDGKSLNDAAADIPRHFPHANKIRRIYVTAEQLPRLNGGELAVVQVAGRYLLVTRETGETAQSIDPEALVLACDPQAVDEDGVPADLVW